MTGRTLGHYQITEKLGEGGMGVVYKARDTHLDRFVALKILPPEKVADPDRKRRFEQEAKSASALNHPNIITIYDIDNDGGSDFIAMEYVAGKTLAESIGRKGLPTAEALKYAVQISGALGAAHAAGIVHRDLKPANIMITDKGLVKVLDFGLVKLTEAAPGSEPAVTATAQTSSGQGVVVGTVAYMSPEQAEGRKVDARSDIFSFGAVLYEMVTGRRPFAGETGPSTMAAILAKEPVAPGNVVRGLPFEFERAILRCLRKDPQRRWQTMADLQVALQDVKDELESGTVSAVAAAPARPSRRIWMLASGVSLVLLAAAAVGWWLLRPGAAPVSYEMERLTFDGAAALAPAISADGSLIAYASDRDGSFSLYLRQYGARQAIRLTGQETKDWYPCFSPDGLKLVYRSERDGGGLYIRDALAGPGGAEMKLVSGGELPSFSPDGTTIAYLAPAALTNRAALFLIAAGGGTPRPLQPELVATYPSSSGGHQKPLWSPDGTNILLRGMRVGDPKGLGWWIVSTAGGEAEAIEGLPAETQWLARYALAWRGQDVYYMEGEPINGSILHRVRLAPRPWRVAGAPEKLASYPGVSAAASTSSRGRMVFASNALVTNIWSASLKPDKVTTSGQLERITSDSNGKLHLAVAANGSRLAYSSYGPPAQGNAEVHLREIATGRELLIAGSGKTPFLFPVLSPDGSKVAYWDMHEGKYVAFVAEGGATSGRAVCEGCIIRAFFPNPAEVLVGIGDRFVRRRLDGAGEVMLIQMQSPNEFNEVALSPDGNRLAFTRAKQDGTAALYQTDITHPPSQRESWELVAEDRNHLGSPAWSPDSRLLYYVSRRDGSPCIWAQPVAPDGKVVGAATAVLHLHSGNGLNGRATKIRVTADRLFLLLTEGKGEVWAVDLGQ